MSTHGGSGAPPPGGPGVVQSRQHLLAGYMIITTYFVGYHGNGSCNVLQKPGCLKGVFYTSISRYMYVTHNAMLHVCVGCIRWVGLVHVCGYKVWCLHV